MEWQWNLILLKNSNLQSEEEKQPVDEGCEIGRVMHSGIRVKGESAYFTTSVECRLFLTRITDYSYQEMHNISSL